MTWEVCLLDEVEQWVLRLDERAYERVAEAIELLERVGPGLGRPAVDSIEGSRHPNLKELRAGSVRVLFAFDPARQAVLLVAGDKAGLWSRWYRTAVPLADRRFDEWLAKAAERGDDHGEQAEVGALGGHQSQAARVA
nr:type II toxin-antitoxin system RelE/ParE family toxin [Jiangella muralis]